MFTATLDTSVLWPSLQRDFLLSLAIEGAYRPTWSSVFLEELEFHERAKLVKRGSTEGEATERASALIAAMRREFSDAEVAGWEPLEGSFGLPDPDSRLLTRLRRHNRPRRANPWASGPLKVRRAPVALVQTLES